ncbi:MAG: thiamine-phosphate kinase [Alistipes sp.]|nr:thiamine-phosphate kinase [Alistipes sp.]MDE6861871.1 thiamine-phosphate kinase [Alistipes sp.]
MSEFGFISSLAARFAELPDGGFDRIGDDCTTIDIGGGESLVMSTDMLVEGIHFLREASSAYEVGCKSLLVNLSDVAAMGARPVATMLSLSLPSDAVAEWAEEFMRGYYDESKRWGTALAGGDTTSSRDAITVNVVAIGRMATADIKRRSDARVGDMICVSGKLGSSAAGLRDILNGDSTTVHARLHRRGNARIEEGAWLGLRPEVHAMMDISDGIASDMRHIMERSGVGAAIAIESVPTDTDIKTAVTGGEDYELLMTVAADECERLRRDYFERFASELYVIGRIVEPTDGGIEWLDRGRRIDVDWHGFEHY